MRRLRARGSILLFVVPLLGRADSFDDLRQRWQQELIGGASVDTTIPQVRSRLASIQSAGKTYWASLQKSATRQTLWTDASSATVSANISTSYSRLHAMAIAWATPGQTLYQDPGLLADLISGLDWMDAHRYNSGSKEYDNWYDWEIGSPADLVDIAVLLEGQLSADQLSRYMAAVERFDSNPADLEVDTTKAVSTGANLTDKCKIALLRGALVKEPAKIMLAVQDLSPVFAYVTASDGFYVDGSFIQHTHHPYTGSYGLQLLSDVAELLNLLAGSPWDVTDPGRANVSSWAFQSFAPLIYEGAMMDMVRGRAISRYSSSDHVIGHSVIAALLRFSGSASSGDAAAFQSDIKRWLQDDTSLDYSVSLALDQIGTASGILNNGAVTAADLPTGSRVYASMDRALHLRPTWAAGIAMHSTRIYNYESINNENLKGWHTGDGMTYLYNADLTQFSGSFWPTVDPQRLPGTTVVAGSTPRQSQLGGSNAVGGASVDGYSAVMMQLNPDGRLLNAKKSWFLLDDELVALGADIGSTAPGATVETIIDSRRLTPDASFTADPNGAWANLASSTPGASIGYYFPDGAPWQSLNAPRSGAWRDLNSGGPTTVLTAQYQTLWFDHGVAPAGATYSYILLPGMGADDTAAYAGAPGVQIVENDATAQAVIHAGLGIQAVNFWAAGQLVAGISSDGVASVVAHQSNGSLNLAVADPTQANNGVIHIEIATPASAVVSQDDGVSVDQLTPTVQLSISVKGAHGKSFHASLSL
jgi:hyaluronate lyase